MSSVKKFQCQNCGQCCKNGRGRLGELGKSRPLSPFVYEYISRYRVTIPLHEWELPVLRKEAMKKQIALKILPFLTIWDVVNKLPIVLNWTLDHDDCPFLSKNKLCNINDNKPLVCKAYPLHCYGLTNPEPNRKIDIDRGDCPNAVVLDEMDTPEKIRYTDLLRRLHDAYGSSLVGMIQEEAAVKFEVDTIESMSVACEIYPELMNKNTEALILSKKPAGLFEVLRRKKPAFYYEATKYIKGIYALGEKDLEMMLSSSRLSLI